MEHPLISTIVAGLVAAFICGFAAKKLHLPAIVGYLMAGMLIGPYTPGFVADVETAKQLAEIGIILLMFGVGLHFSFADLMRVQRIAVPGAFFQMLIATLLGMGVAMSLGFSTTSSFLFGFSLSVASTIVLLRALEQRNLLQQESGKIAVGWLIVEDIAMVLALVLLPVLAGILDPQKEVTGADVAREILAVLLKVGGFFALMLVVGRRLLPPLLVAIAQARSRELTTLGTLAIALGFAYLAYTVFGASFALGAFLAGLVLSESEIGYKAAEQSLPMRDAFAVLFFVSVGMLFNPMTIYNHPLPVAATVLTIVIGKALAALVITKLFRQPRDVSLTIAFSLAQIGEFSFILGVMSVTLGMMEETLYHFILAGALLSTAINPFLFSLLDKHFKATPQPAVP
jgi:CPA2 family monovalent cation:H+ antiporter-2